MPSTQLSWTGLEARCRERGALYIHIGEMALAVNLNMRFIPRHAGT